MPKKRKGARAFRAGQKGMLDKLTAAVLGAVNAASGGAYKVMETGDFIEALPSKLKTDAAGVENALRFLAERGYIDIRYFERGTCCVCSLRKGRTYEESAEAGKARAEKRGRLRWLPAFLGAFFGAFAGGSLAALLFLFLH